MAQHRNLVTTAKRIVIKIGSRALASDSGLIARIAGDVADHATDKRSFVIVSSGAIAFGYKELGYKGRPKEIPELQASAAVGQTLLMQRWAAGFSKRDLVVAQVLLTHADLTDRERLNNARQALAALLDAGAVPIINENDTVATDEIRFGDNDQLASMVTPLVSGDLLLLLTDVKGVLDEQGEVISLMGHDAKVAQRKSSGPELGSGGIASKVDAARKACRSGAAVVIANATEPHVVSKILRGDLVGTLFEPYGDPLRARKHWIAFTLRPRGAILIDAGASKALRTGKTSLLPVGVLGVRGLFAAGDSVRLVGPDGIEIGRGLTRFGAMEVALAAGKSTEMLRAQAESVGSRPVVVHKDDLVLSE